MSWIRSEDTLLHHYKTAHLKVLLQTSTPDVIGRLHMLWWWCIDYAIDGDLRKKEAKVIEDACQIPLKHLIRAGFIDSRPYRRIHGWWKYQSNYLKVRYRDQPDIWQRIKDSYDVNLPMGKVMGKPMGNSLGKTVDVQTYGRTDVQNVRTDVDVKKLGVGSLPALAAGVPLPEVKSYEDAEPDELCGPPKDLFKELKEQLKGKK